MPRRMRPRYQNQGLDKVVKYLRDIATDGQVSGLIRLAAVDRLAVIDRIYNVELHKLPVRPVPPQKAEEEVTQSQTAAIEKSDEELDRMMKTFDEAVGRG